MVQDKVSTYTESDDESDPPVSHMLHIIIHVHVSTDKE